MKQVLDKNQHIKELTGTWNMLHKYNNKDLSHLG